MKEILRFQVIVFLGLTYLFIQSGCTTIAEERAKRLCGAEFASTCINGVAYYDDEDCYCVCYPPFCGRRCIDYCGFSKDKSEVKQYASLLTSHDLNADFYPIRIGQEYTYLTLNTDNEGEEIHGFRIFDIRPSAQKDGLLFIDTDYIIYNDTLGSTIDTTLGPILFQTQENSNEVRLYIDSVNSSPIGYHALTFGDTLFSEYDDYEERLLYTVVDSVGAVTVPAGTFEQCAHLRDQDGNGPVYAPGVGLIKSISDGRDAVVLIAFNKEEPCEPLGVQVTAINPHCNDLYGGYVRLDIDSVMTEGLSYSWTGPSVIGDTSAGFNLDPGTYSVVITQPDGCTTTVNDIVIDPPTPFNFQLDNIVPVGCGKGATGAIEVTVTGGAPPYLYLWQDYSGEQADLPPSEDLTDISQSGMYVLSVLDANFCSALSEVYTVPSSSDSLSIQLVKKADVSCGNNEDGFLCVEVSGGTPPYTYRWNDGQYSSPIIFDLPVGTYNLEVIDNNGCIAYAAHNIFIQENNLPKTINVQGLLMDSTESVIADGIYDVVFSIYPALSGDSVLWTEERNDVVVSGGLFSIMLGEFEALDLCFDRQYYLGIKLTDEDEMSPRLPLSTSPYAFMASNVPDNTITTSKIRDKSVTLDKIRPDILSGINGIKKDGGNIAIKAGDNINITSDAEEASITITAELPDSISTGQQTGSINDIATNEDIRIIGGQDIKVTSDDSTQTIIISNNSAGSDNSPEFSLWNPLDEGVGHLGQNISLLRPDTTRAAIMSIKSDSAGYMATFGANSSVNIHLTNGGGAPNHGFLAVRDDQNITRAGIFATTTDYGIVFTSGPNANRNTQMSVLSGNLNHGFISAKDGDGTTQAGMYVDAEGNGRIFADVIDSYVDYPTKSGVQIRYVHLKGPEAGTYLRGTAELSNGVAIIDFPDHFVQMIEEGSVTVVVSPLSEESKGIAVIKKGRTGFRVKELLGGKGNYEFDYIVHAVQKGFGNMEILQKKVDRPREAETVTKERNHD